MTKKEKKQKALAEDVFIQSLPQPFKAIFGGIKYNWKEISIVIIVVGFVYILAFNLSISCNNCNYAPQKIGDIKNAIKE